jgi:hypothetical protein
LRSAIVLGALACACRPDHVSRPDASPVAPPSIDFLVVVTAPAPEQIAPSCPEANLKVELDIDGRSAPCVIVHDRGPKVPVMRILCNRGQVQPNRAYRMIVRYRLSHPEEGIDLDLARASWSRDPVLLRAGINNFEVSRAEVDFVTNPKDGARHVDKICS